MPPKKRAKLVHKKGTSKKPTMDEKLSFRQLLRESQEEIVLEDKHNVAVL